jgi:selenide,water dikinase
LPDDGYRQMLAGTTQLNAVGPRLAELDDVHAMTDVTGFGLLGHLHEICRGSGLGAHIAFDRLPLHPAARALAQQGFTTGAAARNWASYGDAVRLPPGLAPWQQAVLCDPQTSGGLLVSCARAAVDEVMALFRREGFEAAAEIGAMRDGEAVIVVDHGRVRDTGG